MLIGIIVVICIAAACVAAYVIRAVKKTEHQKCYDAAYKVVKEECLNNAIRSHSERQKNRRKQMLYLKWKDGEKQGFVFDPEQPVGSDGILRTMRSVYGKAKCLPVTVYCICIREIFF